MSLTDAQIRAMGFDLPTGTDLIRNGDDNISKNARTTANLFQESFTDRGILPTGTDLNTVRTNAQRGAWRLIANNDYDNLPNDYLGTQSTQLIVIPSHLNGRSATQLLIEFDRLFFRTAPLDNWGGWRRVAISGQGPEQVVLNGTEDTGALEPGPTYLVQWQHHVAMLGLPTPDVTGSLTVFQATATRRYQVWTTYPGQIINGADPQRYQIWVRGQNNSEPRGWLPWRQVLPGPGVSSSGQSVAHDISAHTAASNYTTGRRYYATAPDTLDRPASIVKAMTLIVARENITNARLDQLITVTEEDTNPGGSGGINYSPGDQISWRHAFYAMMLPSSNWTANIIARAIGAGLSGTGTAREKFVALMNTRAADWGWNRAKFINANGLGNNYMTAAQIVDLLYRISNDSFALGVMGTDLYTINIAGSNPRSQVVVNTTDRNGDVKFPEMVAAKTGSLNNNHACLAMLWRKSDGTLAASALMGSTAANRFQDMREIINTTKQAHNNRSLTDAATRYRGNILPAADSPEAVEFYSPMGRNAEHPSVWIQGRAETTLEGSRLHYDADTTYRFQVDVAATVPGTRYYIQLISRFDGGPRPYIASNILAGSSYTNWTTLDTTFKVPESGEYVLRIYANHTGHGTNPGAPNPTGHQWFRGMQITEFPGG